MFFMINIFDTENQRYSLLNQHVLTPNIKCKEQCKEVGTSTIHKHQQIINEHKLLVVSTLIIITTSLESG